MKERKRLFFIYDYVVLLTFCVTLLKPFTTFSKFTKFSMTNTLIRVNETLPPVSAAAPYIFCLLLPETCPSSGCPRDSPLRLGFL